MSIVEFKAPVVFDVCHVSPHMQVFRARRRDTHSLKQSRVQRNVRKVKKPEALFAKSAVAVLAKRPVAALAKRLVTLLAG